jgi:DNA transposition AAA+ family ATPase
MSIARRLNVSFTSDAGWVTAKTPVFDYIYGQLKSCQQDSLSGLICDRADIGKTYTALVYVKEHRNAVYIDCTQVKTKSRFIQKLAREFGLDYNGSYANLYDDLVYYLRNGVKNPLIVLDEAGDLEAKAFLELKALWNATERLCGWYMMGADGLKAKIELNLKNRKVGYTELYSRYGNKFQKVIPAGKEESEAFIKHQVSQIAIANGASNVQKLYAICGGSLRRIYTEVQKQKSEKSN